MATSAGYLWQQSDNWRFFARLDYRPTRNLPLDTQLTLGGDNGLRGYPNRYQIGDRSVLASLEQRYYSGAYPFGLFRVGYAAFVDVGRAWFEDEPPAWVPAREGRHFDTLSNVGVGLRLESVRTRRDRLLHIDFAKPLVDGPGVNTWEFTITAKQSF
jgi:hemolysin activation/secretion protein